MTCPSPKKVAHRSYYAAMAHAKSLAADKGSTDVAAYRCACGSWHVGHSAALLGRRIKSALRPVDDV